MQWGAWAGVGMAVDAGVVEQLEQQGMGAVLENQGIQALELAVHGNKSVVGAIPLHWPVLLGLLEGEVPLFLSAFEGQASFPTQACLQQGQTMATGVQLIGFVPNLTPHDDEALHDAVEAMVLQKVHEAAGVRVSANDPLMESGLDSLAASEL